MKTIAKVKYRAMDRGSGFIWIEVDTKSDEPGDAICLMYGEDQLQMARRICKLLNEAAKPR